MKNFILAIFAISAFVLVGCINSSTAWTNRSVTYQVTPENIGEHSAVSGSPTSNDSSVNADKTFESAAKTNVAQQLTDNSANEQMNNKKNKENKENSEDSRSEEEKK